MAITEKPMQVVDIAPDLLAVLRRQGLFEGVRYIDPAKV